MLLVGGQNSSRHDSRYIRPSERLRDSETDLLVASKDLWNVLRLLSGGSIIENWS